MNKKICLLILLLFAACLTPCAARAAEAEANVPYLDGNGEEKNRNSVTVLDSIYFEEAADRKPASGWYVVRGTIDLTGGDAGPTVICRSVQARASTVKEAFS